MSVPIIVVPNSPALLQTYEFDKSNTGFLQAALKLADFIEKEYHDSSAGYMIGYIGWEPSQLKITNKSAENNAALYAAFYKLYQLTGDAKWRSRAESIYTYLENNAWNKVDKFFWCGTKSSFNPDRLNPALDANTISLLALGRLDIYKEALTWVERNCRLTADGFTGFDFNTDKDGIWFEGTAQMALLYKVYGRDTDSDAYIAQLRKAQTSAINNNKKGITAASHDGVTTGFENENYYAALHIGATAWFLAAEREMNILWGRPAIYNVPCVQPKIKGKVTLESRTNHSNKVTFYLTNPGRTAPLLSYVPPNDEDTKEPGIQITTDLNGNYELINLPIGIFDLYAKPDGFLRSVRQNISLQKDALLENVDFLCGRGGDCNNDNIVNSKDIAIIKSALWTSAGSPNWNSRADINGDGAVTSLDLSIANNNIGKSGALGQDIIGAIINIIEPEDGAIALGSPITVNLKGTIDQSDAIISVNGSSAAISNGVWKAEVILTNPLNTITAKAIDSKSRITSDSVTIAYSDKKPILILDDFEDDIRGICDFRWWGTSDGTATYLTRYKDSQISKDGRFSMKTIYQKWPGHECSYFDIYPAEGSSYINLADYSQLRFWLYTKDAGLTMRVALFDRDAASLTLPDFISMRPGEWQEVVYDFSGTSMIDFEHVNTIRFIVDPGNDHAKSEFNIDGIKLVAKDKQYLPITPAAPVLSGPQPGHIYDSFKISWSDTSSSGGRLYELWESKDINFTNPIKYFRSTSSLTLEGMVSAGTYYYKVRAWTNLPEEGGISSPWSGAYEVITADEPPEIEKVDSFTSSGDNDNRYERGLLININVVEKYKAKDITGGTVRITSASAGYDSGIRQLSPNVDGTYRTYAWDTIGLTAASDYVVNTTLTDSSGKTDSDGSPETPDLTIALQEATAPLLSKLVENTDLSYPGRGMSVKITRIYDHSLQDVEPFGLGWTHSYVIRLKEYPDGRVDFVMGDGKETSFTPLEGGAYTNKPGVYDKLTKNADGTYRITKKDKTTLNFDTSGKLLTIADTNGNAISLSYDADNRLIAVTDPSDGVYTFAYKTWPVMNIGAHTRLASITDPAGRVMKYYYDDCGMLTSAEDAMNNVTCYKYAYVSVNGQNLSRLSEIQYPEGGHKYFTYYGGDYGRLASEYKDNGEDKRTYIYSAVEPKLTIRDYYNKDTVIYFNESGKMTSVTDAYSRTTRYTWDADSNRTGITDPEGSETNFTYDTMGNLLTVSRKKDSVIYTTAYAYDETYNKVADITDSKGRLTTEFDYDPANGNLIAITNKMPDEQDYVTNFAYDASGQLNTKTDAKGRITRYAYYNNGLLKEVNKQESPAVIYTTAYTYDTYGNPASITDAEGNTTTYSYNALNQILEVEDANFNSTAYTYGRNGSLKTITDAKNNTTTYNYDQLDRLASIAYEDGSNISYTYDKMSNLVTKQDQNNKTTAYTYDNIYRLSKKRYHDTTAVNYAYYDDGALKDVTDSNGTIHYDYDEWNELTQAIYPGSIAVSYAYDELGNRVSMTYPSGKVVHYTYDIMNRMKTITLEGAEPKLAAYTWNELFQREQLEFPNGSKAVYAYDALNRLESLINSTSTDNVIAAFTYTHDKVGNRKTMTDNEGLHQYAYDDIYQLTGVDYPAKPDQGYVYDPAGNRATVTEGGAPAAYTVDNMNRYTAVDTTTYGYNNNGCLTSKTDAGGTTTYQYDFENRLTKASSLRASASGGSTSEATEAIYTYDYLGRRTQKILQAPNSKLQAHYIYDGNRIIAEYDDSGSLISEYVYGNSIDEILYMLNGNNAYYYHYDGLGSVRTITDGSEIVVETYTYDVYGKPTIYDTTGQEIPASQFGNRYYFTGREYDKESGLYYYRARYYDPILGRFMSMDPMGPVDGPNLYTYCGNDSVNMIDPEGKFAWVYWLSQASTWVAENFEFLDLWKDIMEEEIEKIKEGIEDLMDQIEEERKAKERGKKPGTTKNPQPPKVDPPQPPVKLPPFPEGENILGPLMGGKK